MTEKALGILLDQFIKVTLRVRELKDELSQYQKELDDVNQLLAEHLGMLGLQSINLKEGGTVYLKRSRYVNKKSELDQADVVHWLNQNGYSDFIQTTYSPARVKSLVLEMIDGGQEAPEVFNVHEKIVPALRSS